LIAVFIFVFNNLEVVSMEQKVLIEKHRKYLQEKYIKFRSVAVKKILDESINRLVDVLICNRNNEGIEILLQELCNSYNEEDKLTLNETLKNHDLSNKEKLLFIFTNFFPIVILTINNLTLIEVEKLYDRFFYIALAECFRLDQYRESLLSEELSRKNINNLVDVLICNRTSEEIQNLFKNFLYHFRKVMTTICNVVELTIGVAEPNRIIEDTQKFIKEFSEMHKPFKNVFCKIEAMYKYFDEYVMLVAVLNRTAMNSELSDKEKLQTLFAYDYCFVTLAIRYLTLNEVEELRYLIFFHDRAQVSAPVLLQTQRDDVVVEAPEPHQPQTQHDDI
jgi:hypothetical protein